MPEATCVGCGCDDFHPCVRGGGVPCFWLRVDARTGEGLCSSCGDLVQEWDRGNRKGRLLADRGNAGR